MRRAVAVAETVRRTTAPNPWVGCVVVAGDDPDLTFEGATAPPGGPHAEATALALAGDHAAGGTLFTTLEPCVHFGRTPPCTDAIIAAGIRRVVIGIEDPDPQVAGRGVAALRAAGIEVGVGTEQAAVTEQLAPYLKHRSTGQPWVVLKMAATPRCPDRRPRRLQPLDHRAERPARRPPSAVPLRCRAGGCGHGAGRRSRADGPAR